jgi:hypothetical protein
VRRGYRAGHVDSWIMTWYAVGWLTASPGFIPSTANPSRSHLVGSPPGGSATTSVPPTRKKGAAHSAVTAGGPKLRATTQSALPRRLPRPASSARWATTSTRLPKPISRTASRRKAARLVPPSSKIHVVCGQTKASGRPGSPPPLPRSTAIAGGVETAPLRCRALSTCGSTGPGPRKPSPWARSRTDRRAYRWWRSRAVSCPRERG